MTGDKPEKEKREVEVIEDEILKELLTCGALSDYGCGSRLEKYHTGSRLLWSCPKCGERGDPISDDRLQTMKSLLLQSKLLQRGRTIFDLEDRTEHE
jgi:hypothetical protein